MVDKYPSSPGDSSGESQEPASFGYDPEFHRGWSRMEKLVKAQALLGKARDLDADMQGKLTKKFLSRSGGHAEGGKYPFPHYRLKLKPKNNVITDVRVVALRYPTDIGNKNVYQDKLYIAYEDSLGEHSFFLAVDQYSALDPLKAFSGSGAGLELPPNPDGLTAVNDMDLLLLESILGQEPDFELDLQPHDPDIGA